MKVAKEITNLVLVKVTATWIGNTEHMKDGQEVVFLDGKEDWRKRNCQWVFHNGSQHCVGVHHLDYKRRLKNVRYEFKEAE